MFDFSKKKKKVMAIEDLLKKANANDVDALYELSLAYYRGLIVSKNIKKSSYWLNKINKQ